MLSGSVLGPVVFVLTQTIQQLGHILICSVFGDGLIASRSERLGNFLKSYFV